jgi:hypothetical protein
MAIPVNLVGPDDAAFWPRTPVAEGAVDHVNAYFPYGLGLYLGEIAALLTGDANRRNAHGMAAMSASFRAVTMEQFISGAFIPLSGSNERGLLDASLPLLQELHVLAGHLDDPGGFEAVRIPGGEIERFLSAKKRFEDTFALESGRMSLYFVPQCLAYDTHTLLERGERAIPDRVRAVMPAGAVEDFTEAARCLAFSRSTAVAFHVLRSAEAMIREYLRELQGEQPHRPSWSNYIDAIKRCDGYSKHVVARVDQLRGLERNELFHVDRPRLLTKPEGEELFSYALGVIQAIGLHIFERRHGKQGSSA